MILPILQIADSRIVGEKREVPVFVTGESAAGGKYEAIFEAAADEPEKPQPQKVGEAASFTKEQVRFPSYRVTI